MPTRLLANARVMAPIVLGAVLLAAAAWRPTWELREPGRIAVMVDLSASTRGASYRDPGLLRHYIDACLGGQQYDLIFFANGNQAGSLDSAQLGDLPSD